MLELLKKAAVGAAGGAAVGAAVSAVGHPPTPSLRRTQGRVGGEEIVMHVKVTSGPTHPEACEGHRAGWEGN